MRTPIFFSLLVLVGCGGGGAVRRAEPVAVAAPAPVVEAEPVDVGPSFPAEGVVETLPDGIRELRAPGLRLRTRDGLGWVRAIVVLEGECGAGNPAQRSLRHGLATPDGRMLRGSAGLPLLEIAELAPGVCSGWLATSALRELAARSPAVEPFILGRSELSAARLAELLGPSTEAPISMSTLGTGIHGRAAGTEGDVEYSIEVRAGGEPAEAVRIWLTGPAARIGEPASITLRGGRASATATMAAGEGTDRVSMLFLASRDDAEALAAAPRLEIAGLSGRLRFAANPLAEALAARTAIEALLASRPADFGIDEAALRFPSE